MMCIFAQMDFDRMNWNDLRHFLEVARKGRFLSAAKRLGVNHTTVARRISALEDALEVKLFEQDKNGLHLTDAGETLLPLAQQVENAADLAKESVLLSGHSLSGNLRIGAPDGFGNAFLAGRINKFMAANPDLTIELLPVPASHNLLKREVDLAISLEPTKRKGISVQKITDYKLFLYTSYEYTNSNSVDDLNINEIIKRPFADYIPDILYTEQLSFNKYIDSEIVSQFQSSTVLAQYEFVANGGGFGVLPYFMAHDDPRLVLLFPEKFCFIRSYWLLIPNELRRLASVRALESFILSLAKENRSRFIPDSSDKR